MMNRESNFTIAPAMHWTQPADSDHTYGRLGSRRSISHCLLCRTPLTVIDDPLGEFRQSRQSNIFLWAYPAVLLLQRWEHVATLPAVFSTWRTYIPSISSWQSIGFTDGPTSFSRFINRWLEGDRGLDLPLSGSSSISYAVLAGLFSYWLSDLRLPGRLHLVHLPRISGSSYHLIRSLCSVDAGESTSSWALFQFSDSPTLALSGSLSSK